MSSRTATLRTESSHDANFVITGDTRGCWHDNLWCYQCQQSWHHDNYLVCCVICGDLKKVIPFVISLTTFHHSLHQSLSWWQLHCSQWWKSRQHDNLSISVNIKSQITKTLRPFLSCTMKTFILEKESWFDWKKKKKKKIVLDVLSASHDGCISLTWLCPWWQWQISYFIKFVGVLCS